MAPELLRIKSSRSADSWSDILRLGWAERVAYFQEKVEQLKQLEQLERLEQAVAGQNQALQGARDYALRLESEIARKNTALDGLEERVRKLEAELGEARKPRLPWKRTER